MRLFGFELRRAEVIGRALIPAESFGGLAGRTDWRGTVARQVDLMPGQSRVLIHLVLALVWFAPFFMGYFRFFGGLSPEAKIECLERLFKVRVYLVRQLLILLKLMLATSVLGNEEVLRQLKAYDFGQPVGLTTLRQAS